jgi:pimeloyl-ACP methyl ester carboxylesterase
VSGKFTEQALLLGIRQSLVGILTRPTPAQTAKPAIVILNTGIVHRVGHNRMYVTMARACASAGHAVLRFDFSGIGDSERRADRLSPVNACLADIKEALDSLEERHRISQFVLVGLCSGADFAVLYGHTDPRVVGLVLMDPSIPPTARYYFHYVAQRLRSLRNWVSVATGRSGLLRLLMAQFFHGSRVSGQTGELTLERLQFDPYLARCYENSVSRGIRILAAFTSISPRQTYRQQMLDAFPDVHFNDQLKLIYFPESDHLFSAQKDRSKLNQALMDWFVSALGAGTLTQVPKSRAFN